MSNDHRLTPPNRGALWLNLALTKTQLAELCGLTPRQIGYWTQRGYINTSPSHPDRYNGNAIDLCVLIRQGLEQGLTFRRSLARARQTLHDEMTGQPGLDALEAEKIVTIREQLGAASAAVSIVLQSVEPLAPHTNGPSELPEE